MRISSSQSAFAMVIRNPKGNILFLATKLANYSSPYLAKLRALAWAVNYTKICSWENVSWVMDALNVVNHVKSKATPSGWDSTELLLQIRDYFANASLTIDWSPREAKTP